MTQMEFNSVGGLLVFISEPYISNPNGKRLGETLLEADLVSGNQILLAIREQAHYPDLRIGEILALRGWLSQKTADFFAERWPLLQKQKASFPLGYYLEEAGLLTGEQIARILAEQEKLWLRFGAVAVLNGWIKRTTLDFFLSHLFPQEFAESEHRPKQPVPSPLPVRSSRPEVDTQIILQAFDRESFYRTTLDNSLDLEAIF